MVLFSFFLLGLSVQRARMLLLRASWVSSARPSASSRGGRYMPKRPLYPLRSPYQPPTGLSGDLPHASTVPGDTAFFSSAAPRSTQSPRATSHACRFSIALKWYFNVVEPTWQISTGGSAWSSLYIVYSDEPGGVLSNHGSSFVPAAIRYPLFVWLSRVRLISGRLRESAA